MSSSLCILINVSGDVLPLLSRPLYPLPEAARLSHIPLTTLKRWLFGHHRRDARGIEVVDPPVLRTETDARAEETTWGEFIEALYLRAYRNLTIPLPKLRRIVDELRDEKGTPYPLATQDLLIHGREVFRRIAGDLVSAPGRQGAMEETVVGRLKKLQLEFSQDGYAIVWMPEPLIRVEPEVSFGLPVVESGIRTEIIYEAFHAGDSVADLSRAHDIPSEEVEAAIRFEQRLTGRTAAA